jgi:hypothetical protein
LIKTDAVEGRRMTQIVINTKSHPIVAFDEALGSLAAARHLQWASEAEEGAEWALQALEDIPENFRASHAGCIAFARDTASALLAASKPATTWSRRIQFRCEELAQALNFMYEGTAAAMAPPAPLRPHHRQHKSRKPRLDRRTIARAEKATGKAVTSVTTPDGYTLYLDETKPSDASNPWDVAAAALREKKELQ